MELSNLRLGIPWHGSGDGRTSQAWAGIEMFKSLCFFSGLMCFGGDRTLRTLRKVYKRWKNLELVESNCFGGLVKSEKSGVDVLLHEIVTEH